jgi:hypothetical protein
MWLLLGPSAWPLQPSLGLLPHLTTRALGMAAAAVAWALATAAVLHQVGLPPAVAAALWELPLCGGRAGAGLQAQEMEVRERGRGMCPPSSGCPPPLLVARIRRFLKDLKTISKH